MSARFLDSELSTCFIVPIESYYRLLFYYSKQKCKYVLKNITVLDCKLIQRIFREIDFRLETFGIIYQINTPRYFGYNAYSANMYCIWNVADEGFVTYRIFDQQLQEPSDCDGPGCDCPDSVTVTSGASETKVCGSAIPSLINQLSPNGLQVKFCSDNMLSRKGVLILAFVHQTLSLCKLTEYNYMYWTEQELTDFNFKIGQVKIC